ncbi:phage scaffolding protein [Enterococcus olivae]
MNREELKGHGLTDEQIEKVMAAHGKAVKAGQTAINQVEALETERDDLKKQLSERDKDLKKLQKDVKDNEELTQQVKDLQAKYDDDTKALQTKLDQTRFDTAISEALSKTKARDPKDIKALLNMDEIKLDGDKLTGLDSQIETLQKEKAYLFDGGKQEGYNPSGGGSDAGAAITPEQFKKMASWERAELAEQSPEIFSQLTGGM